VQGYFLTYVIAYLRDFALNFCCKSILSLLSAAGFFADVICPCVMCAVCCGGLAGIAESFETSAPWEKVLAMCINGEPIGPCNVDLHRFASMLLVE
jgi:hypothetical protein